MTNNQNLTKEFLAERDLRIFKMRQAGVTTSEIGRRFGISTGAVNSAIRRQLEKLNREALMAYPEVLRMELERLDALQQSIWPLTQHRKVTMDDGTEQTIEPDMKAIQQVLGIWIAAPGCSGWNKPTSASRSSKSNRNAQSLLVPKPKRSTSTPSTPKKKRRNFSNLWGTQACSPKRQFNRYYQITKKHCRNRQPRK